MGLIYMATNKVNGKQYIGQTWGTLVKRKYQHNGNKTPGKRGVLGPAIKKHGKHNFTWKVLHDGLLTQEEMDRLEYEEIVKRGTLVPNGYNIREGGSAGRIAKPDPKRIAVMCIETGERYESISSAAAHAGAQKGHIIAALRNPNRTARGKHYRYVDPLKHQAIVMAQLQKDIARIEEAQRVKAERARQKAERKKAESKMNSPWHQEVRRRKEEKAQRSEAIRKEMEIVGEREWYAREARKRKQDPEWWAKLNANRRLVERCQPKPVLCVETGVVYPSKRAAAMSVGIDHKSISQALRAPHRTARGHHWRNAS